MRDLPIVSMPEQSPKRECGTCDLCCRLVAVDGESTLIDVGAIVKPAGKPCNYLDRDGECGNCSIYEDRPRPCAQYHCMWLDGYFSEYERPDKTGVVCEDSRIEPRQGSGIKPFRIIHACADERRGVKLLEALDGFLGEMIDDDTVVVMEEVSHTKGVLHETCTVAATEESYRRYEAFVEEIQAHGLAVSTPDGIRVMSPA